MAWTTPGYSKSAVDRAGEAYIAPGTTPEERELALLAINNWRSSHGFPLNTFQVTLRDYATRVDKNPLVAQRLKRLPSIRAKLQRFDGMKLSRMQDIGGCRAVVAGIVQVYKMDDLYDESRMKHVLVGQKDYIADPKESGYAEPSPGVSLPQRQERDIQRAAHRGTDQVAPAARMGDRRRDGRHVHPPGAEVE